MTSHRLYRGSALVLCVLIGVFSSVRRAHAQPDFTRPSQAEALSSAVKANPKLAKDMAKALGSTQEEAAGTAGALFSIAKSFLKPEDFEKVSKAVPGMDALLAAVPQDTAETNAPAVVLTPGFAASSSTPLSAPAPASTPSGASTMPVTMAAPAGGIGSAISILSKMGINPAMLGKAVPFLTDYLKKNGGKAVSGMLGQVFKTGKQ